MIFTSLIISLALTLIIEVPLAYWQKVPIKLAILVNILTNPLVVILYFWAQTLLLPMAFVVIVLELGAIIVEGSFYKKNHPHPFLLSLILNGISFGVGLLV